MKTQIYPNYRDVSRTTVDSYVKRKLYEDSVLPKPYFQYYLDPTTEMGLYGLVDLKGEVVLPVTPNNSPFYSYTDNNIPVMDIVYSAFSDMKKYIQQNVYTNKFDFNGDVNLLDLTIKKSYLDATTLYINYLKKYTEGLNSFITEIELSLMNNFDDFIKLFVEFSEPSARTYPLTRTAFITSNFCNPNISGLSVEIIANGDKNSDETKYNNFIANPNFLNILDAAQRYGFMIDKNAPWKFIFDINSPAGVSYMRNVGIANAKELFEKRYYQSRDTDIISLKNILLGIYETLVRRKPTDERVFFNEYCKKFASETTKRELISIETLNERYNDNYWIRLYTFLRAKETGAVLTQEQFDLIVTNAQKYNSYSSHEKAMSYLSSIFVIPAKRPLLQEDLTGVKLSATMKPQNEELVSTPTFKF